MWSRSSANVPKIRSNIISTPLVAGFHHAVHQGKWLSIAVTLFGVLVALATIGSVLDRRLKVNGVLAALAAAVVLAAVLAGWQSGSVTFVICGLLLGAGLLLLLLPSSEAGNYSRDRGDGIVETAGPRQRQV
jgi:drug/metabolite transporter (DMT)-like permease